MVSELWEPNGEIRIRAGDNHAIQGESGVGTQGQTAAVEVIRLHIVDEV